MKNKMEEEKKSVEPPFYRNEKGQLCIEEDDLIEIVVQDYMIKNHLVMINEDIFKQMCEDLNKYKELIKKE